MEEEKKLGIDMINTENFSALGSLFIEWGAQLIGAILILVAGWVIGNWVRKRIRNIKRMDPTLKSFLAGFSRYAILAVAIVAVLGQFGIETASLLAVLGAAGLAIGLALQGTLSNVAAGAMLLILRPFQVGDYITAGAGSNLGGTVVELGLFGTELATPENIYIYVPNGQIWNKDIWNYNRNPERRQDIRFGISYKDDIGKTIKAIHKMLEKEERILKTQEDRMPQVMTEAMGASSIDFIARFWCKREDFWNLKWDITKAIKEELDKNGISIPFPTRTIEMINTGDKDSKKKAA